MFGLILLAIIVCIIYVLLKSRLNYWKKYGIKNPPPNIFFGNLTDVMTLKRSLGQIYCDIYNDYPNEPYVGIFKIRQPGLIVRDPKLVGDVMIKKFSDFHDNDIDIKESDDILFGKNPFVLKGNEWKVVRSLLSPCFSSGKVKSVYPLIQECAKKLVAYLEKPEILAEYGLDAKELSAKYTTEVIASCAFGLEGNCFQDPNAEFREIGKSIFTPSFISGMKQMLVFLVPGLARIVNIKMFPDKVVQRFKRLVEDTLKYREINNIIRNDYMDILKSLNEKPGEYKFTNEDVVAHLGGFFTDGFETSSIILSFILHEIATNLNAQEKLRKEIEEVWQKRNGDITYDDITEMIYLDCVLKESMRKYPVTMIYSKLCTNTTEFPHPNPKEKPLKIEKGTSIVIPVYALQNDEKYYPNPKKFDPDRFLPENKESIPKFTYMPFGDGPRICIGQRFGILQVKIGIVNIVKHFDLKINKKTKSPIQIDPTYFLTSAVGGIWIDFHKRRSNY